MPYNFVADSFHTEKIAADFLQAKCDFLWRTAVLRFQPPRGFRGNVGWSFWARWKARSKLLIISVNWSFFARC